MGFDTVEINLVIVGKDSIIKMGVIVGGHRWPFFGQTVL